MPSKCNDGKYLCKYLGDLPDICLKYRIGERNGDPIIAGNEFPTRCYNCEDRDFNFCMWYKDLICFHAKEPDPYDCEIDLSEDKLHGIDWAIVEEVKL